MNTYIEGECGLAHRDEHSLGGYSIWEGILIERVFFLCRVQSTESD